MAGKNKTSTKKSKGKLARFFANPRNVILAVFVLGFALVGGYKVYQSSAATGSKSSANVNWCNLLVQNGKLPSMKIGSEGVCVTTLGIALNGIREFYRDQGTNTKWVNVSTSTQGSSDVYDASYKSAVVGFQGWQKLSPDGAAGKQTWGAVARLCNETPTGLRYKCGLNN